MDLFLIRHGETEWNRQKRCQGVTDVPLCERGRTQASFLRSHLSDRSFDLVYSSHLSRAFETACIVSGRTPGEVQIKNSLHEMNQGELEGLAWDDLLRSHGKLLSEWMVSPANIRMPGGETLQECGERVAGALLRIREEAMGKKVLVVSHNLAISAALAVLLGFPLNEFRRFRQEPCAINRISWHEETPELHSCNDYSFLPSNYHTVRYGPHADADSH